MREEGAFDAINGRVQDKHVKFLDAFAGAVRHDDEFHGELHGVARRAAVATDEDFVAGAELVFIPSYSQDLNPIEMIFAKIKQTLRSLACRTREALWTAMQSVLDTISPSDAANCFRHCGYTLRLE